MVHKKYIKRGNKLYGPYYYESYREGDKVKKRYISPEELGTKENNVFGKIFSGVKPAIYVLFFFLVIILILLAYNFLSTTGKVSAEIELKKEPLLVSWWKNSKPIVIAIALFIVINIIWSLLIKKKILGRGR